jgi:hypothetical protein
MRTRTTYIQYLLFIVLLFTLLLGSLAPWSFGG